jgi:hypothetical protein
MLYTIYMSFIEIPRAVCVYYFQKHLLLRTRYVQNARESGLTRKKVEYTINILCHLNINTNAVMDDILDLYMYATIV